jgi:SHS2 domain-containing protein
LIHIAEHTGEFEMEIAHPTLAGLYAEAVRGLVREIAESGGAATGTERLPVSLDSSGPETLLADLLNEVIFRAETRGFVSDGLEVHELDGGRLRATLVGRDGQDVRPLVKAATYHDLRVWHDGKAWHGRVVLDV